MEYTSPADAFSSTLEKSLFLRQQQQRQALEDDLASKREARLNQAELDSAQERQDRIRQHGEEEAQKVHDKTVGELEKRASKMVPGDIPDPEMMATADKVGVGGTMFPKPAESMPGIAAVPLGTTRMGVPGPADAAVRPYIGDAKQREQQTMQGKVGEIRDRLASAEPGSAEERSAILDYEMLTNKQVPARSAGAGGDGNVSVFRVDPQRNVIQRSVTGIDGRPGWQDHAGDVPKGAHWLQEQAPPQPKDHSTQDATALAKAYESAVGELNKRSVPIEGHISAINDLGMALNQNTPQADALIAPLVLKATVSGTGTGFRMTQSEINQVLGARNKWDGLKLALDKWSTDPTKALSVTDEQRVELRQLAKAIRVKASGQMQKIIATRHALDDASDPATIKKLRTNLQDELSKQESDEGSGDQTASGPKSAADYLKEFNAKAKK